MPIPDDGGDATTTELHEWVDEVRHHLDGPKQGAVNVLASGFTAGGTTLTFLYPLKAIAEGSILSLGENTFLVLAADETAKTATVVSGWASSDDADAATGSVVRVNPRFTDHRIVKELNHSLSSLSSPDNGLYQVLTETLSYASGVEGYDLDAPGMVKILEVRRQTPDVTLSWPRVWASDWRLIEDADLTDFPSGRALRVSTAEPGYSVQVVYAADFDTVSGLGTLVSTSGIPATAEDIPPLDAAIRLMAGREVSRATLSSQGDTRRATEVPSGSVGRSYGGLVGQLQRRIAEEKSRLNSKHRPGK